MIGVFGDLVLDISVRTHGPLQPRSDVTGEITCRGGGSAANVAAWLASLGSQVRLAGAVGSDPLGSQLAAELDSLGIELFLVEKPGPSGMILLFVDEQGERTMVTSRGANLLFEPIDLSERFFTGLGHLHLTGYSFFGSEPLREAAAELLDRARRRGIPFSVDPASYALLAEFGRERFLRLTRGAAVLFPNLDEGRVLTGAREPEAVARELLRFYPRVVLTLGAQGCLWAAEEGLGFVPAPAVEPVDTTGAGDAFAAGFLRLLQRAWQAPAWVAPPPVGASVSGARPAGMEHLDSRCDYVRWIRKARGEDMPMDTTTTPTSRLLKGWLRN